jgi:hypothetical protein
LNFQKGTVVLLCIRLFSVICGKRNRKKKRQLWSSAQPSKKKHQLEVFPCHNQHHVFVFYAVIGSEGARELCTPAKLAQMIKNDSSLLNFFNSYGIVKWAKQYAAFHWNDLE